MLGVGQVARPFGTQSSRPLGGDSIHPTVRALSRAHVGRNEVLFFEQRKRVVYGGPLQLGPEAKASVVSQLLNFVPVCLSLGQQCENHERRIRKRRVPHGFTACRKAMTVSVPRAPLMASTARSLLG